MARVPERAKVLGRSDPMRRRVHSLMARIPRNGFAVAARMRRGGFHPDRRAPRGGARNEPRTWLGDRDDEPSDATAVCDGTADVDDESIRPDVPIQAGT